MHVSFGKGNEINVIVMCNVRVYILSIYNCTFVGP